MTVLVLFLIFIDVHVFSSMVVLIFIYPNDFVLIAGNQLYSSFLRCLLFDHRCDDYEGQI